MLDPPRILQSLFLLSAATVLLVDNIPALRSRFLAYGPRTASDEANHGDTSKPKFESARPAYLSQLLDALNKLQVPHSYFLHFYIVSIASSTFWPPQIYADGRPFRRIASINDVNSWGTGMSADQVLLTWSLMAIQGFRRLMESITLARPSKSKMWFVHWLLGVSFYLAIGIAVWIEGAGQLLSDDISVAPIVSPSSAFLLPILRWSAPSLKTLIALPIFILASGIQHDCHTYLASLPKYTLPVHPIFNSILCPHYTMECLIYLSLAIISAPRGAPVNQTVLTGLVFVATNLSVTAKTTKEWYERKFGSEAVAGRPLLIPYLY